MLDRPLVTMDADERSTRREARMAELIRSILDRWVREGIVSRVQADDVSRNVEAIARAARLGADASQRTLATPSSSDAPQRQSSNMQESQDRIRVHTGDLRTGRWLWGGRQHNVRMERIWRRVFYDLRTEVIFVWIALQTACGVQVPMYYDTVLDYTW